MATSFSYEDASTPVSDSSSFSYEDAVAPAKKNKGIAGDLATDIKRGVMNIPSAATGLLDIPVAAVTGRPMVSEGWSGIGELTGFQPKKWAKEAEGEYSDARRTANQEADTAWESGTPVDVAKAYLTNPMHNIVGPIAESGPSMLAGGLAGRVARVAGKLGSSVSAGIGEGGIMAGQAMGSLVDKGVDPRTAAGYSATTGVVGGVIGAGGGRLAQKFGMVDPDTAIVGGVAAREASKATGRAAVKESGKRILGGGVSEGLFEEVPQSIAEQGFANLAQGNPVTEGMARAGVEGGLAGFGMGAAFNAMPGAKYIESKRTPPKAETEISGLLPAPKTIVFPNGTVGTQEQFDAYINSLEPEQRVTARAQAKYGTSPVTQSGDLVSPEEAQANADRIYAERAAYEQSMAELFPYGQPMLTQDIVPLQQRIDEMLGINQDSLNGLRKAQYRKQLEKAFNEPVGITHDENGLEIPLTMGALLDSQATAEQRAKNRVFTQYAQQQAETRAQQLADEETATTPDIPIVGPLSAAANQAVKSGITARLQLQQAAEQITKQPAGKIDEAGVNAPIIQSGESSNGSTSAQAVQAAPEGQEQQPATEFVGQPVSPGVNNGDTVSAANDGLNGTTQEIRDDIAQMDARSNQGQGDQRSGSAGNTPDRQGVGSGRSADARSPVPGNAADLSVGTSGEPDGTLRKVRAYPKGQAQMLSSRATRQGLPFEIYPHPTQAGMFAIRAMDSSQPENDIPAEPMQGNVSGSTPEQNQNSATKPVRRPIKPETSPIMRRDDLVGAIMRATGGRGIHSNMATTLTGDTANRVSKLRGLFTAEGQQDMDDLAMLLRENEGYDVEDGSRLAELIRDAAAGNYAKSMARTEQDKAADQEKQYREQIRDKAKKYGIKTVAVKFSQMEAMVLKALEQRHAKALELLDAQSMGRFNAAVEQAMAMIPEEVVDDAMADVSRRGFKARDFWNETTRILRGMIYDAQQETNSNEQSQPAEARNAPGDGQGNSGIDGGIATDSGDQAQPGEEFSLAGQTLAEVKRQEAQRQADEEAAKRDEKPKTPNVTVDQVDLFNTQGGLFDGKQATTESAPANRFEAGAALTKEQRKSVLETLTDVYKANRAPREFKGMDSNGNERYGYAHSPEFFVKSDITGAMLRYHVTLPDGRIAHPSELFPDYTQSDVEAAIQKQDDAERSKVENDKYRLETLQRRTAGSLNEANRKFNLENKNRDDYIPATLTNGRQFIRTPPEAVGDDLRLLGDDWKESPMSIAAQKASIDEAAHEAATSPQNDMPLPTEAQKSAMNYKMGHVTLHGLDITIENPQGSVRSGVDADGKPWENTLANHYGYIKRTEGNDGDHVDVFIGDNPESELVFIVDQKNTKTGAFDEHKVLLGFSSLTEAKAGYANSYQKGWMLKGVIAVTQTTLDELKAWIATGDMSKPFAPQEAPQKALPERVAEAKADSAEREKDEKGNQIYRKGERVEFTSGRNAGRHGAISEAVPMVTTSIMMFSNETPRKSTTYYYQVQTDNGIEVSANSEEIAFETSRPESVVLDPVVDGRAIDPLVLHNSIGYARQSAENYRASAQRARKASAIAEHKRNAEVQDLKASKAQEAWSAWAKQNPAESEKIAPSKILPASPAARKEAETGTTTATPAETLKGVGLIVSKGLTNNGKEVWNVSGNTKEHSSIIKAAGGRWYGPKKVWSFYNADPSAALSAKFSGQTNTIPAPALASNEVQIPGSHYVYAKDDQGWTWRVGNGPAYNGRGNSLQSNAPIIEKLESLLSEKNPTINRQPTIEMTDTALEKVLVNAETTTVEKDRAEAELEARDAADQPDIGAMFDEVLAEETAPEKPDPWKTVLVKANSFMTIDGVDYRVRNDFSQGNKDAGEPVSLRTSGMIAQVVEKPYAEVEAAIKANKEKVRKLPTPQIEAPTPAPKPRTAGQAAGSAVVNAAKGTGDVFDALGALFGSKGSRLSMGLSFDEDTYRQAKPLFISAIAHFKDAATDLKEAIRAVIKEMNSRFSPEVTENMKPYVVRFFEDVRARNIVYDESNGEYKDGTQTAGATNHGTLPGIPSESVSSNESGGDAGKLRAEQSGSGAGSNGGSSGAGLPANGSMGSGAGGSVPRRRKPKSGTDSNNGNLPSASPGQSHPVQSGLTDYVITDETRLGEGGAKTKFKNNLAAIRLINELDTSGRPVTRSDQDVLARYVGWGMLPQAFDATNKEWATEFSDLKGLLNEDEWNEAYMSTQYAHYTSEQIISNGIYAALERFGFSGGKILEPGSGVGNFVGLMPTSLRTAGSRVTGIERERISSKIGQYLYPTHNMLQADFTEFQSADGYFDAVAGNPPFAATALTDASGRKHLSGLSVHNYFFAKSVDLLRPGGVFAMVVSNSFLDGQKDNARRYIGERTRFLGAIRLPNNAFKKNAGTEVTTDLIFLQKLEDSAVASKATKEAAKAWMETSLIPDPLGGESIPLNDYFVAHPEMMLGRMERSGSMYRAASSALVAKEGADITAQLRAAVALLPAKVYVAPALAATSKAVNNTIVALEDATVQPGGMYTKDGALYVRLQNEAGEKLAQKLTPASQWTEKTVLGENRHERLIATADLRRTVRQLLAAEIKDDTQAMKQLRSQLNTQYDAIVKKWDFLSSKSTIQLIGDDPDYPLLAALETDYNKGIDVPTAKKHGIAAVKPSAKKMPIFTQRVIPMHEEVTHAETPVDALMVSIYERGHIDQQYISDLLDGRDGKEVIDELVAQGHLFLDPEASHHVLKDEYLSGNVRRKIKIAQAAGLNENVRALEKVIPEDVPSHNIIGKMGASWISNEVYQDFINELLGEGTESRVKYQPTAGSFIVEIKAGSDVANTNTLGIPVDGGRATDLIEKILNKKQAKIGSYDQEGKFHLDKENTDKAADKIIEIKTRFGDWLFKDAARSEVLTRAYNDTVNNYVVRRFDGAMLTFPGKVPDSIIKFRRHQRNAIARILQSGQALLDHVVGAGKTFTIVAAAMEMRRTGIAHKPMVVVPNHLVKQWASDFYRLYPGAKVLAATKNDFKRENRRAFMAKIATGDWDAVIIAHSTFGFIKPAPEFEIEFNGAQIKDITDAINELGGEPSKSDSRDKATKRTVKQLAKMREKLQEKIKALRQKPMDNLLDLAELGVDALFVDEAHKFKNLMFTTKMQGVRVGGDPTGSQRAYDMYVKTQQVMKKSGRGVVFATGTPISNTMAEMYHMLRYLAPQTLTDMGLKTFDAWADSFASAETFWMQSMSGSGYKASTRLEKFVNVPSLLKIYDQVADTVTMEDIKDAFREENPGKEFPIPPVKGGGARTAVSIKRSQAQTDYMGEIAKRSKALEQRKGPPKKGEDNMLSIMGDARKAAMDIRLVDPSITERDPEGRIAVCAENVWQRYQQYHAVKGTQLIFSDMGTPKKTAGKEMDEYKALKERADKIDDLDLQDRATLGDEEAITILEDAEEAATEIDKKGQDWLDAIQTALRGFSIYDDMKEALMEKGIPEHEIAFIHSYNTDDQKAALFKSVNSGIIRVLLGSTEKMGAGTNVQERAVAAHHLDVPWKPSDVEQREGRVVRQGNRLLDEVSGFEVEIMAYATQDTLDLYMWQTQENKLKMIGQLRTGKVDIEMDNAFEAMEFSAGEMQAAATSNPYLLDEIRIKEKIKKLERQKRSHEGQLNDIINRTAQAKREIDYLPAEIKTASDIASGAKDYEDKISAADAALKMTVQGVEITGRENIRKALNDALSALRSNIIVNIAGTDYPVKSIAQFDAALAMAKEKAKEEIKTVSFDGSDFTLTGWGNLSSTAQAALDSALDKTTAEEVKKSGFELGGKTYKSYSALAEGFRVLTGDREGINFSTGGQSIIQRSKLKEAVSEALSKAVDGESRELLGQFGEVKVYVEAIPFKKDKTKIVLNAQVEHNGSVMDRDVLPPNTWDAEVDPSVAKLMGAQVVEKALQIMRGAGRDAEHANDRLTKAKRTLSDVEANTSDTTWPGEAELKEARAKYDTVLKQLSGRAEKNAPRNRVDDRAAKAERMAPFDSRLGNIAIDGKISPADKAVYGMAAEGKSAVEILEFIASASRNPFYRKLARLLQKTGITPSVKVGSQEGWTFNAGNDKKYAAAYDPKSDSVALFRPAAAERNVLHELMHAATLKAMGKKGLAAVQMRALFNHVKATGKLKGMYGMANVDEFVAEAFTNPKFQQALKRVNAPVGSTGLAGAWDWFVRVVRGILGIKQDDHNALSAALEIGVGVMRENMRVTEEVEGVRYNVADDGAWSVSAPSKMDDVIYSLQDKHIDTKRVIESIRAAGKKILDQFNPYLQEELFHGRAAKGVKDFLDLELRPLLAQMQADKIDMGDFEEYLWNRHAEERNRQIAKINPEMKDGGSGLKTADAQAYLAGLSVDRRATFERLAARVDVMNRNSQGILVSSGLETQDTIDAWNGAYKNYVPLQREDVDTGHVGTGKGFSIRGSSSKRAMGSGRNVVDIIANITMQRERNIVRAEKNRVSNALLGLAMQQPNADFWTVDQAPKERVVQNKAIYTVLDADGKKLDEFTRMDEAEKLAGKNEGSTIDQTLGDRVEERVTPGFSTRDNVVMTRLNGQDHYVIFNERNERALRMATSLKNMDADQMGRVLSVVGKATRYLARVNTQYNPVFGVINLIRDAQGALLNLSSTPLAGEQKKVMGYTVDALRGIYADIRAHRAGKVPSSKWAELFEEFQKEGGQTGYRDQYANAADRSEAIRDELKQFTEGAPKKMLRGVFAWLSDYNETMENAVRLASYKAGKEQGMSNQQAASLAKSITVNFNRKGQAATQIGALYAFFNASVQGTARIGQTLFDMEGGDYKTIRLSKTGKKIVYGGILLGSLQAMLLAAAGFDDDEPPDFVRERNLILPIGDGKYLTLAMPLGFHVLPGIGRIATEFALSGFKDPAKRIFSMLGMFTETFNPIGSAGFSLQTITPSVVDPFAALAENRDFSGKDIARENMNPMDPKPGHLRAKDTATYWSKAISSAVNFITGGSEFKPGMLSPTPDQLDYLIGQATGGVGREVNKVAQTIGAGWTGEDLPLYKVPLVGRFIGDTSGQSGESSKFYDSIRRINGHEAEFKGLMKQGRKDEAREYMAENPEAKLIMMANFNERQLQKMRTQKRDLLKGDYNIDQVKSIDAKITEAMRRFNERVAAVSK